MKTSAEVEMQTSHPYVIGSSYFFQTITNYFTGRLVAVWERELVIESAAWIPECGRFSNFLVTGKPENCEPYPVAARVILSRESIVSITAWVHALPSVQK